MKTPTIIIDYAYSTYGFHWTLKNRSGRKICRSLRVFSTRELAEADALRTSRLFWYFEVKDHGKHGKKRKVTRVNLPDACDRLLTETMIEHYADMRDAEMFGIPRHTDPIKSKKENKIK